MKLTKNSQKLLDFFTKIRCFVSGKQTQKTQKFFTHMYHEIKDAMNYIENLKKNQEDKFYNISVEDVTSINQIPKPTIFPANSFPLNVRRQIDDNINSKICFTTRLFNRNIKIYFLLEDTSPQINTYKKYFELMLVWLYIINKQASKNCSEELTIFIYHTSLKKILPNSNIEILGEEHVNTAFTSTCPRRSEIIVFRKEEWFKVFMHETFHNFGLDFSDMNNQYCNKIILNIFPVETDVNLYEAYTEFWARIMNSLFCSYILLNDKNNINTFLKNSEFFINMEIIYSYFQTTKVLNFMGLEYTHLFDKSQNSETIRKSLYKENTSVLAYYVITLILINNYQSFISWCLTNNTFFFQFEKNITNQKKFCKFIEKKYKTNEFLSNITCSEMILYDIQNSRKEGRKSLFNNHLLDNLRMTLCELE